MSGISMSMAADRLNLGKYKGDTGVRFARRAIGCSKSQARNAALSVLSARRFPKNLSVLTMPNLAWSLERSLINNREHGRGRLRPRRTFITAIERSHVVYKAALSKIPGGRHGLVMLAPAPYAKHSARSYTIQRYHQCDLRALVNGMDGEWRYDAAWIDLCGPITPTVLSALVGLWDEQIKSVLILTSLRARYPRPLNDLIRKAGGLGSFLRLAFDGRVIQEFEYIDGSPMHQIAFLRETSMQVAS